MEIKRVYLCSDGMSGIFSAVYDAWKECRDKNAGIGLSGLTEQEFFCEYVEVEESQRKVRAVEQLICRYMGVQTYEDICYALLSEDPGRGDAVFHLMQAARRVEQSRKIMDHLGNPYVRKVFELKRSVVNESHQFIEFIRFRELKNGVLLAEISPRSRVLTCIAGHFADRFPLENWMICDRTHGEVIVHEKQKQWVLIRDILPDQIIAGEVSKEQEEYEKLWKLFFHTISIRERENPGLQRGHLPVRFRGDMTEFRQETPV